MYDFYKELNSTLVKFPKSQRYSLGQKIDKLAIEIFELVITASNRPGAEKLLFLEKASVKLDVLKLLLRLAKENHSLADKNYLRLELLLQEIGKMLGGWLKHTKQIT